MHEIKTEVENFSKNKEIIDFRNYFDKLNVLMIQTN